ncbi:gastrula zinc finger protein xFG20-1-like [Syngnathus acus]|uniref:gastrula zinc finger protein xFG20-1-like n=1 Tax=Syngnathus acus TaxID=161584 RepID=UPI001885B009|nr:gastrula zinc finger protein xFG20-1-like [Syngnathus acus]
MQSHPENPHGRDHIHAYTPVWFNQGGYAYMPLWFNQGGDAYTQLRFNQGGDWNQRPENRLENNAQYQSWHRHEQQSQEKQGDAFNQHNHTDYQSWHHHYQQSQEKEFSTFHQNRSGWMSPYQQTIQGQTFARMNEVPFVQMPWTFRQQNLPEPSHIQVQPVQFQGPYQTQTTQFSATSRNCEQVLQLHHSERDKNIKVEPLSSRSATIADGPQKHLGSIPHIVVSDSSEDEDSDEPQKPLKSKSQRISCYARVCSICHQFLPRKGQFIKHYATHVTTEITPKGEKIHTCATCGKSYSIRHRAIVHARIHCPDKEFSCSECGKSFTFKQQLKKHMMVHTGEKPFSCSVCGKRSSSKRNLETHMVTHSAERPFSCSLCSLRFKCKISLNAHKRTHTGERPFTCSVCFRSFSLKSNLETHMRTHTGERPFACSECDLKFLQKTHLTTHMNTHTGVKPYSCAVCYKRFFRKSEANKHKCAGEKSSST